MMCYVLFIRVLSVTEFAMCYVWMPAIGLYMACQASIDFLVVGCAALHAKCVTAWVALHVCVVG